MMGYELFCFRPQALNLSPSHLQSVSACPPKPTGRRGVICPSVFCLWYLLSTPPFELIQKINRQGTTIFMVEQNANMALSIAI